MAADNDGVYGPIDYLLLQFPEDADLSATRDALLQLVDLGVVRIYDLLVIRKEQDGSFTGLDIADLTDEGIGSLTVFAGARSGLLSDDDLGEAAGVMDPGTTAALLVYENSWAVPFVAAARAAKAELISSARIPAAVVMEVLEALEAADTTND